MKGKKRSATSDLENLFESKLVRMMRSREIECTELFRECTGFTQCKIARRYLVPRGEMCEHQCSKFYRRTKEKFIETETEQAGGL